MAASFFACVVAFGGAAIADNGWMALPDNGYWQHLLHLGENIKLDFAPEVGIDTDQLMALGGEADVMPYPGMSVTLGGKELKWSALRNAPDGTTGDASRWNPATANLIRYWHIYIFVPGNVDRTARFAYQHDDEIRVWLNGAVAVSQNGYNYSDQFSQSVTLKPGVNRVLIKIHEGGPTNMMAIGLRMDDGTTYFSDFLYRLDYSMLAGAPSVTSLTQTDAVISAELTNHTGVDADVFVGIAAADWGDSMEDWRTNGTLVAFGSIPNGVTNFNAEVTQLAADTSYAARLFVTNDCLSAVSGGVAFRTYSAFPAIESRAAAEIDSASYSATGALLYTGSSAEANVFLHWGEADGETNVWQTTVDLGMRGVSEIASTLSGLQIGTSYFYRHSASNAAGVAWAPESISFTTPGYPIFDAPQIAVFSDAAKMSVLLARAGAMAADVSLLFGESASTMEAVRTWHGVTESEIFTFMTNNLPSGATRSYAFVAVSALPSNPGVPIFVSTPTNSFVVGNNSIVWDNHINFKWNTSDKNWHASGAANGSSFFAQGDAVNFRTDGNLDVLLTESIDAERVDIALGGGHLMRMLGDVGAGAGAGAGATLSVLDELSVSSSGGNSTGTIFIEEPQVSGAARIVVERQTLLNLGNPANDYTGGTFVRQGGVGGIMAVPANTLFGSGDIVVGANDEPAVVASVGLSRKTSGAEIFSNTSSGALVAAGSFNSGRLTLTDAGGGISARFSSITQDPAGASLSLHRDGTTALFLDTPFDGVFPPWFVIAGSGGNYAKYDAVDGVVPAAAFTSDITASTSSDLVSLSGVLASGGSAAAVVVDGWLRLQGNTITLGNNGVAGLLMKENLEDSVGGGGIDAGDCDLFVYAEQDRQIYAPVNAKSLRKFGGGRLYLIPHQYPELIVAQEGALQFILNADFTYPGQIITMGELYVPASAGSHTFTFTGADNIFNVATFTINGGGANTNHMRLASGNGIVRGNMYLNTGSFGVVSNAALTVASELRIGNSGDAGLLISRGGDVSVGYAELGSGTGRNELVVRDSGCLAFNTTLRLSGNAGSIHNTASFLNGAELAGAGTVEIGHGGGINTLLFDASSGAVNRVFLGVYEGSTNNLMTLRNNSSLVCNDIVYVGGRSGGNKISIENSTLVAKEISLGYEPAAHDNQMNILAGGSVTNTANLMIGRLGSANTLRVGAGGSLTVSGTLDIGMNSWLTSGGDNMLLLAGGEVVANTLNIVGSNALGVEIQPQGFGNDCGLGELHVTGVATFDAGSLLRPYYAKNAASGKFRIMTASGGITDNGLRLDIPPESENMRWAYKIEGNSLYLHAWQASTLLIVR